MKKSPAKIHGHKRQDSYSLFLAWIVFFSFAICASVLFQKVILPSIPSMHAAMGLMPNDAINFHEAAKTLALRIVSEGWGAWSPWPYQYYTGNVAILGGLYALFGINPLLVLPINAAMHALSGVLLIACGWRLASSKGSRIASVIAGIMYVGFPAALTWYAQVHKDSYADLAYLLGFHALLVILQAKDWRQRWRGFAEILAAIGLIAFVRPQYLTVLSCLFAVGALPSLIIWLFSLCRKKTSGKTGWSFFFLLCMAIIVAGSGKIANHYVQVSGKGIDIENYKTEGSVLLNGWREEKNVVWDDSPLLPNFVNRQLENIGLIHMHMLSFDRKISARSTYDPELKLASSADVVAYVPRAFVVALFAPFPSDWSEARTGVQLVGVGETLLFYLVLPGVFLFFIRRTTLDSISILVAALAILTVLGLINSNLGNLHRIRYPFHFIPMLLGLIGWFEAIYEWFYRKKKEGSSGLINLQPESSSEIETLYKAEASLNLSSHNKLLQTICWIMLISLPGYLGFFLRDMIMAREFGLGAELDAFQVGIVLPTFFAAMLFGPLTSAVIPALTRLRARQHALTEDWIQRLIGQSIIGAFVVSFLCSLLWWFQGHTTGLHPIGADAVFVVAIGILLLSSWINIGNGLLNVEGGQRTAAIGQSLVPWAPIILLLIFRHYGGALLVAIGLMIGQIVNLVWVIYGSRKSGFRLWPQFFSRPTLPADMKLIYFSAAANNFLFGAAVPVGVMLALRLGQGQASAFALGSKFVVLTYAVASAVTTAVVMPYFSTHFVSGEVTRAHRGLAKFLYLSLIVSVVAAVLLFGIAEQIVPLLFGGGRFSVENGKTVAAVVKFGSLQIPFMISNLLIVRFSEASSKARRSLIVTLLAQTITIIFAIVFSDRFGVEGIALAGSLGVMTSTLIFILLLIRDKVLSWLDAGVSLIGWWLFLTVCLCLYFETIAGAVTAGVAFFLMVAFALKNLTNQELYRS